MEMLFFYGICAAPKGRSANAVELETFYVVACVCYIIGIEFGKKVNTTGLSPFHGSYLNSEPNSVQMFVIWAIIAVSIFLCTYLFVAGGMNVFVQSLRDFVSGDSGVYSKQRAKFFGVKGQGYIYQFRVVLLPLLATFTLIGTKKTKSRLLAIALYFLMVVFLLGTGQRNAFVFYCLIVLLYVVAVKMDLNERIMSRFMVVFLGGVALLFLIVLTISNGRVSTGENPITGAIKSIVERILLVNQKTAIAAYNYIKTQPIVWGYDWWMMLLDILPGQTGYMSVDRIVFYYAYGSYNGTGPPCIWASAWYNFGVLGITIFPFLMGVIYHNAYRKMMRTPNKNKLYILLYVALCVYMGLWTYGTPMTLFNNGVVTVLLLRWLLFTFIPRITRRRRRA